MSESIRNIMDIPQIISTPSEIDVAITGRCNLHCKYCFYADEMTARSDLTTEQWLTFFAECNRLGVMRLCLTGGEPFTRPDLFTLIDGIIANRMRYFILTNGTMINEKILEHFETGKRRQRLDYIQISIDGSCAEIHDLSRPSSFERSVRGLRLLKKAGFPLNVRVTINRHNLHDLENIARLLLDDIGLSTFGTNDAFPIGMGCQNVEEVALSAAETAEAMEIMSRINQRYPNRLQAMAGPLVKAQVYAEMEQARATGEKTTRWQMGTLSACGCVFSKLSILHDGTIVPCHLLSDLGLGNITSVSLEEVWSSHPTLSALRSRRKISMAQLDGCQTCEWVDYCNGSCPAMAYQLLGDFNLASPLDCYRKFLLEKDPDYAAPG
jgi:SynChlorMet cassette radical SAM/SPASM protein ScmE